MPFIRTTHDQPHSIEQSIGDLTAALTHPDPARRWTAARSAGGHAENVPILANALSEETETQVREAIFTALVRVGSMESIFVILPYLRSDDAGLRTGAMDALRAAPYAAQAHLHDLLRDPDPDVRILACDLARVINDHEALRLLGELLVNEPEANVCGAAVEVLAEIGNSSVADALTLCAARFPDDPFLSFAVQATLKRLGGRAT